MPPAHTDRRCPVPVLSTPSAATQEKEAAADALEAAKAKQAGKEALAKALPTYPPDHDLGFAAAAHGGDLADFYYYACGEEETLLRLREERREAAARGGGATTARGDGDDDWMNGSHGVRENQKKGKGKPKHGRPNHRGQNNASHQHGHVHNDAVISAAAVDTGDMFAVERALHDLNEQTNLTSSAGVVLGLSGYHPPPAHRRVLGDLAYLEATLPGGETVHLTATPLGFYVNRSEGITFDPAPVRGARACFSHALLDCLLLRSGELRARWRVALRAAAERAALRAALAAGEDAVAGVLKDAAGRRPRNAPGAAPSAGWTGGPTAAALPAVPTTFVPRADALAAPPGWLAPLPAARPGDAAGPRLRTWDHGRLHAHDPARAEGEWSQRFGMDVRGGGLRDWNEELQSAREMSAATYGERIERAR